MATTQIGHSTGHRLAVGEAVLGAARGLDTKPVGKRLARFNRAHRVRVREQRNVDRAEAKLSAQRRKLADADAKQDAGVDALARARVGAGAKHTKPFDDLGAPSPSDLKELGYTKEARACIALTGKILKNKERPSVLAAARRLAKASQAVIDCEKPIAALENALAAARRARDANELEWETAFAVLRDGAKVQDRENGTKLHEAMFVRTAGTRAASKERQAAATAPTRKATKPKPAPATNGTPTNGASPPAPPAPPAPPSE
jgi:hypothetical protein